jgi:acetyltransferase-like isoleucine patch superfamily enzyme
MKTLAAIAGAIALALALGLALDWFGLVTERPMAKYAKETQRQVYENSVAHQDGANAGIGIDCANMENASITPAERHAYASMVVGAAAAYGGDRILSDDARSCVAKAHDILTTQLP